MLGIKKRPSLLPNHGARRQLVGLMDKPAEEVGLTAMELEFLLSDANFVYQLRRKFAEGVREGRLALKPWQRVWKVIGVGTFPKDFAPGSWGKKQYLVDVLRQSGLADFYLQDDHRRKIENIPFSPHREQVPLFRVSMADLNLPIHTEIGDFLAKAERHGLSIPSTEVMFQLVWQYRDLPEGEHVRLVVPFPPYEWERDRYRFDEPYMFYDLRCYRPEKEAPLKKTLMPYYAYTSRAWDDDLKVDWVFTRG